MDPEMIELIVVVMGGAGGGAAGGGLTVKWVLNGMRKDVRDIRTDVGTIRDRVGRLEGATRG